MNHTTRMRQEANRAILELLAAEVEAHPDLRFGQLLMNLRVLQSYTTGPQMDPTTHISDPFNEEPSVTLARMERRRPAP